LHPDDQQLALTAIIFWYVAVFMSIVFGASYSALRSSRLAREAATPDRWTDFYLVTFGRARRRAFWLGYALPFPLLFLAAFILEPFSWRFPWASVAVLGASIWPGIAIGAKRLHDRDKSAWWLLILLVPVIGFLWLLIELGFLRGTSRPNRFGPAPQPK
jgi:uncharacterized membrane protein YhaH (DUF805 family)